MLADELCRRIEGANYYQSLLTRFTTPEEIFGAVSLKALEQDDYRRVTSHKLPDAHIAFPDEIFKANSSILNALLTLINERLFHNGKEITPVPLLTLFGASNELPEEEELTALYDRFLVRFVVNYIAEDFRFLRMLEAPPQSERTCLTLGELQELQRGARDVIIPPHAYRSIADIRRELNKKNLQASDRRYRQCLSLLQAHAFLDGDKEIQERICFSWNMSCGAIRRSMSRCALRFAISCSATNRRSPNCFTSRAKFASRRSSPANPATSAPAR